MSELLGANSSGVVCNVGAEPSQTTMQILEANEAVQQQPKPIPNMIIQGDIAIDAISDENLVIIPPDDDLQIGNIIALPTTVDSEQAKTRKRKLQLKVKLMNIPRISRLQYFYFKEFR